MEKEKLQMLTGVTIKIMNSRVSHLVLLFVKN